MSKKPVLKKKEEPEQQKFSWDLGMKLSSGENVKIRVVHGEETIQRKAKMFVGFQKDYGLRRLIRKQQERLAVARKNNKFSRYIAEMQDDLRDLQNEYQRNKSYTTIPVYKNVKDAKGNFVTFPVNVQGVRIQVEFADGETLNVRSCCKPPDVFTFAKSVRIALKRLFRLDRGINLSTGKIDNPKRAENPRISENDRIEMIRLIKSKGRKRKEKKVEKSAV